MRFMLVLLLSLGLSSAGLILTPSESAAKVIIKTRTKYYTVRGKTGRELFKSMMKRGLMHRAMATTKPRLKKVAKKYVVDKDTCTIQNIVIRATITYTLPRWRNKKNASKKLQKAWDNLEKELIRHEKMHGQIFRDTINKFHKEMTKAKGKANNKCKEVKQKLSKTWAKLSKKSVARNKWLDMKNSSAYQRLVRAQRKLLKAK